jgi:cell division protein FtsW
MIKEIIFIGITASIAISIKYLILDRTKDYSKRMRKFYLINVLILLIGLIFSIALFFLPTSIVPYINGATRWIKTPFFNIAPIEILKVGIVFLFTHILTSNMFTKDLNAKQIKIFIPFLFIFLILSILIPIKQKDFGNFFLIVSIFLILIFILFNKLRLIFKMLGIAVNGLLLFIVISPHRIERIKNWLFANSGTGDVSSNYQVQQGLIHINEGNFIGNGFGESIYKLGYIPDLHTDMIFTLLMNETGFIGFTVYYLLLFYITFFLIYKSIKINNLYTILYSTIVALMLLIQSFINLLGVLSVIPLKGISVPFLSYGGSALLFIIIAISLSVILMKINAHHTEEEF